MHKDKPSRSVYSTSTGRLCPNCENPVAQCDCNKANAPESVGNSVVTISLETKGRGGKEVTVIKQLPLNPMALKIMAAEFKASCGSGGTVSNGNIEIQGDHRSTLEKNLESRGFRIKRSGS